MSDIKKKVLLVCHTAAGQMNLGVLLSRMYFFPVLAKSAEEGIILTKKSGPFSLVLLDGDLPEERLRPAISMLRADQATKGTPLVIITTDTDNTSTEELLSQGCSAVLTKPLDASFVYGVLGRLSRQLRSTPRVPVRMNVEIREETPERMLTCTNISEGGIFLRAHEMPPEKTVLHLKFTLPHSSEPLQVTAEVVRTISQLDSVR